MNRIIEQDCKEIIENIENLKCGFEGRSFLIVGATSFLGSSIVNTLVYYNKAVAKTESEKCEIFASYHNLDKANLKFGEFKNNSYFHMFEWDATNALDEIPLFNNVDYIFYLCSIASTGLSLSHPVETIQTNTVGLINVLNFAKKCNCKSFLYFSSGAVYGAPQGIETSIYENDMWPMNHINLENIYAEGKRAGETICKAFFCEYGIPTKIVRISHTYGPGIDVNDGRVFSDFVKNIIRQENIVIKGDGSQTRPFCYITDAVRAFFMIIILGQDGEAYNMANPDETYSVGELAELLAYKIFSDREINVKYMSRKGNIHPEKVYVNIEKIEKLGWFPSIKIDTGFKRVVESFEKRC